MANVVLVHDDPDLLLHVANVLREVIDANANFATFDAYTQEALDAIAAPDCKLAVIGAGAVIERGRRQQHPHQAIRQLLPSILAAHPELYFAVLATRPDEEVASLVRAHEKGVLLTIRAAASWQEDLCKFAPTAFGQNRIEDSRRTRTVFNISMPSAEAAIWSVERRGRIQVPEYGHLHLNRGELDDLRSDGRNLVYFAGHPLQSEQVIKIGNRLYRELFGKAENAPLKIAFKRALEEHDADKIQIRIVFDLPGEQHELPVETLKDQEGAKIRDWYALSASILRKYQSSGRLEPLFKDKASRTRKLDVLLIAADPEGEWRSLKELTCVQKEVAELHVLLNGLSNVHAESVYLKQWREELPADEEEEIVDYHLKEKLCNKLKERRWSVVHFAGHSFIEPGNSQQGTKEDAQLALSVKARSKMPFSDFIAMLPDAQLLFLSSCQSGNLAFLRRAMAESIPAIVGYVWPVRDIVAYNMAKAYYSALFLPGTDAHQSLGRALSYARRAAFSHHWDWISPVLLTSQDESSAELEALVRGSLRANNGAKT